MSWSLRYGTNVYDGDTFVANLAGVDDARLASFVTFPGYPEIRACARAQVAERARRATTPASEHPCYCEDMGRILHHSGVNGCAFGPGAYRVKRAYGW